MLLVRLLINCHYQAVFSHLDEGLQNVGISRMDLNMRKTRETHNLYIYKLCHFDNKKC